MSKRVFIGVGHGGADSGAAKFIVEKEYTLKTALAVTEYLNQYGIEYKMSRTQDIDTDMDSKVAMCNAYAPDLVVDIHFNAGGGTGFEAYHSIVGGVSKTLAENINNEVKKIFSSRGVKVKKGDSGDYFAIIRETTAPAVLLEGGFVDTKSDADFIKLNYKNLAKAYADGIAKTLGIEVNPDNSSENILDAAGCKKGDSSLAVLNLKALLLTANSLGIHGYGLEKDKVFGDGTQKSVNYLLKKWGYAQNGIAGEGFTLRLLKEIENTI